MWAEACKNFLSTTLRPCGVGGGGGGEGVWARIACKNFLCAAVSVVRAVGAEGVWARTEWRRVGTVRGGAEWLK